MTSVMSALVISASSVSLGVVVVQFWMLKGSGHHSLWMTSRGVASSAGTSG